jgi:hypothetical protein
MKGLWLVGALLALSALLGGSAMAQTWWNPDYGHRVAVSIKNNDASATPTPTSAELTLPLDPTMRADRLDVRAVYYNGTTSSEIDSKVFRELGTVSPYYTENQSAGTTSYAGLPAGSPVTPDNVAGDDSGAQLILPFSFPFANGSSNVIFMSIDGYLAPGTAKPYSQYGVTTGGGTRGIYAYASDYSVAAEGGPAGTALYYYSDATQAVFRWEVAASGGSALIAKFAVILKPDGSIRYVYSDTVTPPPVGVGGLGAYAQMAYGVQVGLIGGGILHSPVDNYPTSATFSNHADILYTPTGATRPPEVVRAVFRLQQPIPAGGTSTGQYFIYYANVSPDNPMRTVKNVFDYIVDFTSAANVVGAAAPDWDVQKGNTVTVTNYQGLKVGVLKTGTQAHPRATVKTSAMPAFLNPEILAHVAPFGAGSLEMAPMARVISDPNDANFQGGYGYAVDAFGDPGGSHIVSYINPNTFNDAGPADMGGVPDPQKADTFANILYRVTGDPGVIQGKNWRDDQTEPAGLMLQVDRSQRGPSHGPAPGTPDPVYNQPGTTGMGGYNQQVAIDYIALRELRGLVPTTAAAESFTSPGPFIQGTLTAAGSGLPLSSGTVTITNGSTVNITLNVGPTGVYKLTVPAGTYTVSATGPACYGSQVKTNVVASASNTTDFALVYECGTLTGVCFAGINNQRQANTIVTLIDSNGNYVTSTTSDAYGFYSLIYPTGGTFGLGAMSPAGYGTRMSVTLPSGGSAIQNLSMAVMANGDCEIPNSTNSFALGWTTSFDAPGAYIYSQAQNHTPGGHWSMAIKDPSTPDGANHLSGLNNPPVAGFNLPVQSDLFDITVSAWVYFTKTGQMCAMRLRDNWPLNGQNRVYAVAGMPPDPNNQNTGGLDGSGKVPVGQWYQIRVSVPAGTPLKSEAPTKLQMNLYAMNSAFNANYSGFTGGTDGTIYFDDWTVTQTPHASALAKVVDSYGTPVAGAYVGKMDIGGGDATGISAPNFLSSPYVYTDDQGNATLYTLAPGPINVGAWIPQPILPDTTSSDAGVIAGTASATASTTPPTSRATLTLGKGTNVAKGITNITAHELIGSDLNLALLPLTVDDKLSTGWYSTDTPQFPYVITWNLGAVKSVNQVEFWWERTEPDFDVYVGTTSDPSSETDAKVASIVGASNKGIVEADFAPALNGHVKVIKFSAPRNIQYIQLQAMGTGPSNNASQFLYEMRALSAAVPPPALTKADATTALKIAAGLQTAAPADVLKLDVVKADGSVGSDGRITIADAEFINKHAQ